MLQSQSDPYVRVQVNNVTKGRTEVINNSTKDPSLDVFCLLIGLVDLNPVWDQIVYIPGKS
jgi:Ca2+-dependent lipid-binding protein